MLAGFGPGAEKSAKNRERSLLKSAPANSHPRSLRFFASHFFPTLLSADLGFFSPLATPQSSAYAPHPIDMNTSIRFKLFLMMVPIQSQIH